MRLHLDHDVPRLDRFLTDLDPATNRTRWEAWIRAGQVRVNGLPATKPGTRLRAGDLVEAEAPPPAPPALHLEPEAMELPTLFEDQRLWIIDKPAGLVVHPGPGHPSGTILNALLARMELVPHIGNQEPNLEMVLPEGEDDDEAAPLWPGLVHRLDRYTTGCLAMAKDAQAQASLQAQFKARTVEKRYLALARNSRKLPELGSLLVDEPIARHRVDRMKMTISGAGRPSQTRFKVLARGGGAALVECLLLTGRTHQIRVHLRHLGAPILGDTLYGGASSWRDLEGGTLRLEHPLLHAWSLALDHPGSQQRLLLRAPVPATFLQAAHALGLVLPAEAMGA